MFLKTSSFHSSIHLTCFEISSTGIIKLHKLRFLFLLNNQSTSYSTYYDVKKVSMCSIIYELMSMYLFSLFNSSTYFSGIIDVLPYNNHNHTIQYHYNTFLDCLKQVAIIRVTIIPIKLI